MLPFNCRRYRSSACRRRHRYSMNSTFHRIRTNKIGTRFSNILSNEGVRYTRSVINTYRFNELSISNCIPTIQVVSFKRCNGAILNVIHFMHRTIEYMAYRTSTKRTIFVAFHNAFRCVLRTNVRCNYLYKCSTIRNIGLFINIIRVLRLICGPYVTMNIQIRSKGNLSLLSYERSRMFNIRRIRCTRLVNVRTIRLASNNDGNLMNHLRFKESIVLCRFLMTTRLNQIVATSTFIPMKNIIIVRNTNNGIRCAVIRTNVLRCRLIYVHLNRNFHASKIKRRLNVVRVTLISPPRVYRTRCNSAYGNRQTTRLTTYVRPRRTTTSTCSSRTARNITTSRFNARLSRINGSIKRFINKCRLLISNVLRRLYLLNKRMTKTSTTQNGNGRRNSTYDRRRTSTRKLLFLFWSFQLFRRTFRNGSDRRECHRLYCSGSKKRNTRLIMRQSMVSRRVHRQRRILTPKRSSKRRNNSCRYPLRQSFRSRTSRCRRGRSRYSSMSKAQHRKLNARVLYR